MPMIKKLVNIPDFIYQKLEEKSQKEEVNLSVVIRDALFVYLNPSKNDENSSKVHLNSSKNELNLDENELNLEEKVAEKKPKRILKKK